MDAPVPQISEQMSSNFAPTAAKIAVSTIPLAVSVIFVGFKIGNQWASVGSILLMVVGVFMGVIAVYDARKHGTKGLLVPGLIGIIVNGILALSIGAGIAVPMVKALMAKHQPHLVIPAAPRVETAPEVASSSEHRMMRGVVSVNQSFTPGGRDLIESKSPAGGIGVVFEDDGKTGRFHAIDVNNPDRPLDTLDVYSVSQIPKRDKGPALVIIWSTDGQSALLMVGGIPQAAFNFSTKRGFCQFNSPAPNPAWTKFSHKWDFAALAPFQ
jgi:hypothetical protein